MAPKLFVVVASVGRQALLRQTVEALGRQTRAPDGIVVVSVAPEDVEGVAETSMAPEVHFASRGSCAQRNHALDLISGRADIVTFLDDDFLASPDYLSQAIRIFEERPDVVGLTGRLIADGIGTTGISFEQAEALIRDDRPTTPAREAWRSGLYGCNMSVRMSAAKGLRFDEALPLYGWQEDIDFTSRLGRHGKLLYTERLSGVHMGHTRGRTSGKKFGYSQVANIIYLLRKGTMPPALGRRLLMQNIASNAIRSIRPERHIDRRGRALGNLMAVADLARGRMDPRRILEMR